MISRQAVLAAVLLGAGGGLRSFAGPAVLGLHDRGPFGGPASSIAVGAATGEVIADKQPDMGSRWAPRGLGLRLGLSFAGGWDLAGPPGAAIAAATALGSAWAGKTARGALADGPHARRAAWAEDALSYGLAVAAVRVAPPAD